jgi:hypothetical protein
MSRVLKSRRYEAAMVAEVLVRDLSEYDVLLSGSVILRVTLHFDSDYATLTLRKNDKDGLGEVSERHYLKDSRISIITS